MDKPFIGFTFNWEHSSTYGIGVKSINRTLIPTNNWHEFEISGRSGTHVFDQHEFGKREIELEIVLYKDKEFEDLRKSARSISKWLSKKGPLVFDDEPDKCYYGMISSAVGLDQAIEGMPIMKSKLVFSCQPFAENIYFRSLKDSLNKDKNIIKIESLGNVETCCQIKIINKGNTPIRQLSIERNVSIL